LLNNSTSYWKDTFNDLNVCECADNQQIINENNNNIDNNNLSPNIVDQKKLDNIFTNKTRNCNIENKCNFSILSILIIINFKEKK
jgi:hypothetical protein